MFDRLELIKIEFEKNEEQLNNPNLNYKEIAIISKQQKSISKIVTIYNQYLDNNKQLEDIKHNLKTEKDKDMIDIFKDEALTLESSNEEILKELKILLLPKDENDEKNVIVTIKGAAGGDEGNIFAGDLFKMYSKYCVSQNWKLTIMTATIGEMGGFTNMEFMIEGENVFSKLKYESGVHRVQRVPETESLGRVHTSTAVVIVLPEVEAVTLDIKWEDIRVDTFTSSGPGGQSVNTTQSAVRLTYIPTGFQVSCQEMKSQIENKERAYRLLVSRLYDMKEQEKLEKEGNIRKSLSGRGMRNEKIRTYNYPQNRITDHRINYTIQELTNVMEGDLEPIISALINENQKQQLSAPNEQ